jgi:hypothetical protein
MDSMAAPVRIDKSPESGSANCLGAGPHCSVEQAHGRCGQVYARGIIASTLDEIRIEKNAGATVRTATQVPLHLPVMGINRLLAHALLAALAVLQLVATTATTIARVRRR